MSAARIALLGVVLAALAGCGEKPQATSGIKSDTPAFQGTGAAAFTQPGWKAGDRTSWEQQLRTRGEGQNEYVKSN